MDSIDNLVSHYDNKLTLLEKSKVSPQKMHSNCLDLIVDMIPFTSLAINHAGCIALNFAKYNCHKTDISLQYFQPKITGNIDCKPC